MQGSWNPVLFATQVLVEASMNMGGHCGYRLPDWLQFLVTMGMGNTPWSGEAQGHDHLLPGAITGTTSQFLAHM